ncbi:NAD binding site FAD dependent oxidoreductase [Fragilariopsis cylindrus CCMP1102]|uniref:L-2-hydroxyglutarate dehydrogenase, mitochondrial n=1 Tax=Fragilariopsis cylindrus CCMP1102 TaxID=635003 RepID=A0A1E7FKQ2_9STRA|nr:NAD binding site FAD dependent oxidoreductase [Fragilariopsis cylindrus CCMP1102]|eukprot:OEU18707.1 NAD binding site FAD dependent oxidoreductase [Fragilariopsis cylindrus CCMP1102]
MLASKVALSSSSSLFHTEVVVIGAGVIGLGITRALAKAGKEVILLEKEAAICTETSSRNSEVIHSGIYYPKASNKAKFCVGGRKRLYQYCDERGILHRKCGKLVVANKFQLVDNLPTLYEHAHLNGVTDVRLLSREDAKFLEPNVECCGALLSPSTGILDSHSFYLNLLADCEDEGATLVLRSGVDDSEVLHDKVCLNTGGTWLSADIIINCAGLHAHDVATKIHNGSKEEWQPPKHYFAKGTYFKLDGKSPFQHLIYPVPESAGLGVHATIDWSGNGTKFGPDVQWLGEDTCPDDINYVPDPSRVDIFSTEIRKYWPDLPGNKLTVDYVGVRPKLSHPAMGNVAFNDFLFVNKQVAKSRIFHLFGIESPGLTSCLDIAEHVRRMVDNP